MNSDVVSLTFRRDKELLAKVVAIRDQHGGAWDQSVGGIRIPTERIDAFLAGLNTLGEPIACTVNGQPRVIGEPFVPVSLPQTGFAARDAIAKMRQREFPDSFWDKPSGAFRFPASQAAPFLERVEAVTAAPIGVQRDAVIADSRYHPDFARAVNELRHGIPGAEFDGNLRAHLVPKDRSAQFATDVQAAAIQHGVAVGLTVNGRPAVAETAAPPPTSRYVEPADYPQQPVPDIKTPAKSEASGFKVEHYRRQGEIQFGISGPAMREQGWSVYPQTRHADDHRPSRSPVSFRDSATEFGISPRDLAAKPPSARQMEFWSRNAAGANTAAVFGPASGHTFAIDIDVRNQRMVDDITEIAEKHLGVSPFQRIGDPPKVALIYRHDGEYSAAFGSVSKTLGATDQDGTLRGYAVEVLGEGKSLTVSGQHHKTGEYFKWIGGKNPLTSPPDAAPLVKPEQLKAFMAAVNEKFPFDKPSEHVAAGVAIASSGGSKLKENFARNDDGKVSDGRFDYMGQLAYRAACENRSALLACQSDSERSRLRAGIAQGVVAEFAENAVTGDKPRWTTGRGLEREAATAVGTAIGAVMRDPGQADRLTADPSAAPAGSREPGHLAAWTGNRRLVMLAEHSPDDADIRTKLRDRAGHEQAQAERPDVPQPQRDVHAAHAAALTSAGQGDIAGARSALAGIAAAEMAQRTAAKQGASKPEPERAAEPTPRGEAVEQSSRPRTAFAALKPRQPVPAAEPSQHPQPTAPLPSLPQAVAGWNANRLLMNRLGRHPNDTRTRGDLSAASGAERTQADHPDCDPHRRRVHQSHEGACRVAAAGNPTAASEILRQTDCTERGLKSRVQSEQTVPQTPKQPSNGPRI